MTFTDLIQFLTFSTVIPIIGYFILSTLDSAEIFTNTLATNQLFDYRQVFDFTQPKSLYHLFIFFFIFVPAFNPAIFQRITMAKNTMQVSRSFIIAGITCFFLALMMSWIGVLVLSTHPNIEASNVVKHVLFNYPYVGLKGLALAGIMAMVMSTADSYVNATSVLFVHDFCTPLKIRLVKDELLFSRLASLLIGLFSILLALRNHGSLMQLLIAANMLYMPIVTVPFIMATVGFRSTSQSVLIGMATGLFTVIIWETFLKIGNIDAVIPGMVANLIALIGSHYLLKQSGGWIGIKDDSPLKALRLERKKRRNAIIKSIYDFDFLIFCKNNSPKQDHIYSLFGLFGIISVFSTMYSMPKELQQQNSQIIEFIYHTVLLSSTIFLTYPIWPPTFKQEKFITVVWNIAIPYILLISPILLIIISNFGQFQLMILMLNIIIMAILLKWQIVIFMMFASIFVSIQSYKWFVGVDNITLNLGTLQFKVMYLLLLVSSILIAFLKPKQFYQESAEQRTDYLEHQVYDQEIELQKLIALRNELINNINHELHTPITGITSLGQILDERYNKFSEKKRREVIKDIANSSTKLQLLIDNIFDLSKISTLNYQLNKTQINLSNLVYDCFDRCKKIYQADLKDQEFILNIQDDIIFMCDEHYIKQTIDNLIANAIKYCKKGKIIISLTKKELIEFSISDEGIGIPKEEIYDIFGAFIVSSKTKTLAGDRGIGLALCKKAIEAHGGTIWVEQNHNKGVTFKFTI